MAEHDGSASPLLDVAVHLFLHLLSLEFEAAEAVDRVSSVDQSETQVKADLFEDILADWFEAQGIRLRRQPEMVKEQSELLGRPVRTPDLLFLDHVYINGQPVAWIDAKHFYGADGANESLVLRTNRQGCPQTGRL